MNSAKFAAVILSGGFLTIACNSPGTVTTNQSPPTAPPAPSVATASPVAGGNEIAAAELNFQQNCQDCHGEKGLGGRVEVKGRRLKVPSLREGHALTHTDEKLVKQISEGDDEMPAFKDKLRPEEINELVKFIRKEFQGK